MVIQGEKITNAMTVFNKLLKDGEININNNPELYSYYVDIDTYEILIKIAESSKLIIKKVDEFIYMLPNIDNDLFGFSDNEIKNKLYSGSSKIDLYLFKYIVLIILSKFYSSTGDTPKLLTSISINNLINHMSSSLNVLNEDKLVEKVEDCYEINIRALAIKWNGLLTQDEVTKNSLKTKRGILLRTIKFLVEQRVLEYYEDEDIIKTTRRCDDIMKSYFLNYDRKEKIYDFLEYQRGLLLCQQ